MTYSEEMKRDMSAILLATIKLQSTLHTLDEIENDNNVFKQQKKKEWNDFIRTVQKFADKQGIDLHNFTADLNEGNHAQNYLDCVNEFDKLGESFNLTIDL